MPIRIIDDLLVARASILNRRPSEEPSLPDDVRATIRRVFGADLSAEETVRRIIADVRADGDAALHRFAHELDGSPTDQIVVTAEEIEAAFAAVPATTIEALKFAAERIRRFHSQNVPRTWLDFSDGGILGQIVRPIERVGVYAPGGRAAYPSTVLMSVIPARAAGVKEIFLATPGGRSGRPSDVTLAAAHVAGVDRIFRIGGAQAIAALAFGTATVPRVDKIVGPGNIFVALAKRQVFGGVAIDQIAGPTETMLVADDSASPAALAADLLAQAEHDPLASAILITTDRGVAEAVAGQVEQQLTGLARAAIIEESLARNGGIVIAPDLTTALDLANDYAPEHLCLMVRDPLRLLPSVRNAGGVFVGEHSLEAIGDYTAGPSHVMPTGQTARFASPLNVLDFLKIISIFALTPEQVRAIGPAAVELARAEGLTAHAAAIELRLGQHD